MNSSATPQTILVVDDCAPLCEMIEVIFSRLGYHVLTATNPSAALRQASNTPQIALLISDLEMPEMRGDELATRFARRHPSAAIILISSGRPPAGFTAPFTFLPKPFTITELRAAVHLALQDRGSLTELALTA